MASFHSTSAELSSLDRGVLEALITAQQKEMLAKDEALAAQQDKLLSRNNEIEHLKLVIAKLRRMIFGTKSEKVSRDIEQLELKLEELETQQAEPSPQPYRQVLPQRPSRFGDHCRNISRVRYTRICPPRMHARTAVASCANWARTSRRFWSECPPPTR